MAEYLHTTGETANSNSNLNAKSQAESENVIDIPDKVTLSKKQFTARLLTSPWKSDKARLLNHRVNDPGAFIANPYISPDGLELYHSRLMYDPSVHRKTGRDIWVASRPDINSDWSSIRRLDEPVNTLQNEHSVCLSPDMLTLFISSNREGTRGDYDLWTSTRKSLNDTWTKPINMGVQFNTPGREVFPQLSADGLILIFSRDLDLWMSKRDSLQSSFNMPEKLTATVNTQGREIAGTLTPDKLGLIFMARSRPDYKISDHNLYLAVRESLSHPFGKPILLSGDINSPFVDGGPSLSSDGKTLFFHSTRPDLDTDSRIWQIDLFPEDN